MPSASMLPRGDYSREIGLGDHMIRSVGISIFLLLVFTENVCSQLPNAGVTISGTVRDPSGAVVAEAQLTLKSTDGTDLSEARTDNEGIFRFSAVPPGRYILYLEQPSFRTINLPVEVGRRSLPPIVVTLALAPIESQVTVSPNGVSVSDPLTNQDAITINAQLLSNLPVLDEDYIGTLSNFLDRGAVGTSGPSIIVDGMEVKNATISQSAIEEVRINDDPYSVEFWRPGKGRIEIITKFNGSLLEITFQAYISVSRLNLEQ